MAYAKTISALLLSLLVLVGSLTSRAGRAQDENHALQFAGDDFVRVGTMDLSGKEVTISAWVKPFRFPNTLHTIAGIERSGEATALLRVGDVGVAANRPQFVLRIEGRQVKLNATETLEPGVWQHVAGSYDGRKMILFIDGQRAGTKRQSGQVAARGVFRVSKSFGGRYFTGLIDEVRVWRGARYDAFVRGNRDNELSGHESRLEGYWRFNEGTGTSAGDHTGNGHHGQIKGAGWTRSAAPVDPRSSGASSSSDEEMAARGFRVHFSSTARFSHLQTANPKFYVQGSLIDSGSWRIKQMKEYLYHIQGPFLRIDFMKVNTSRRKAYAVEGGTFGEYGGSSTDLGISVSPWSSGSLHGFRLDFQNLYLSHVPGKTRLIAGGESGPSTVFNYGDRWKVKRMNREIFHVKEYTWQDHYWQVNIEDREIYEVKGGTFGAFGGQKEPLDAEVERVQ